MYLILDKNYNKIGRLDIDGADGACPFWGDEVDIQIADEDQDYSLDDATNENNAIFNSIDVHSNTKNWNHTLNSINVPYGYDETSYIEVGNFLAYHDDGTNHWYAMRITSVTDNTDASGEHYKTAEGVNACIWELGHKVPSAVTINNPNAGRVFRHMLADTGWILGADSDEDAGGNSGTFEFDGTSNAQSVLQTACQQFDVEIDAYLTFNNRGGVKGKFIELKEKIGNPDSTLFLRFGDQITGITRTLSDENLYTRLYPIGPNGETPAAANGGLPYVQDIQANDRWNGNLDWEDNTFLEGSITSSKITEPKGLRDWGKKMLKAFNHPRYNYTVTGVFDGNLGDRVRVQDVTMNPPLETDSRIIQKKISQSDPTQNQCVIGEFVTMDVIETDLIKRLQGLEGEIAAVKDAKKNPNIVRVNLLTPDGTDFHSSTDQRRLIAEVFADNVNITSYVMPEGFNWEKRESDTGIVDKSWQPPINTQLDKNTYNLFDSTDHWWHYEPRGGYGTCYWKTSKNHWVQAWGNPTHFPLSWQVSAEYNQSNLLVSFDVFASWIDWGWNSGWRMQGYDNVGIFAIGIDDGNGEFWQIVNNGNFVTDFGNRIWGTAKEGNAGWTFTAGDQNWHHVETIVSANELKQLEILATGNVNVEIANLMVSPMPENWDGTYPDHSLSAKEMAQTNIWNGYLLNTKGDNSVGNISVAIDTDNIVYDSEFYTNTDNEKTEINFSKNGVIK